jgi:hypothetical protein
VSPGQIFEWVLEWVRSHPTELTIAGVAVGVGLLSLLVVVVIRALQGRDLNTKASIGFGVVQAGVAYITITGVYDFFYGLLDMPTVEAGLLAGFIEACTWAAVGMIFAHGKSGDGKRTKRPEGFGPAGPFFWLTVCGGGVLAILGSTTSSVAVGRAVVVTLGGYMWYLRLLEATHRSGRPSRWRWTPKRLLLAAGALVPADEDINDEAREWQIRGMARALRWANSSWPWSWWGTRSLVRRAEATSEEVMTEARRRWAAGYLLKTQTHPDSPVMQAVLRDVGRGQLPEGATLEPALEPALTEAEIPGDVTEPKPGGQQDEPVTRPVTVPAAPVAAMPLAAPVGTATPARPTVAEPAASMKERAFALLDQWDDPDAGGLAERLVTALGSLKMDTAKRYVRDWRRGRPSERRLQLLVSTEDSAVDTAESRESALEAEPGGTEASEDPEAAASAAGSG